MIIGSPKAIRRVWSVRRVGAVGYPHVGAHALRGSSTPQLTLAGFPATRIQVRAHAGELCRIGHVGIKATRNIGTSLRARPDCVALSCSKAASSMTCRLL